MDLTTDYLGMELRTPIVPSASPLAEDIDNIKRMEDAGAAAVVLHSLFEEQLRQETHELHHHLTHGTHSFAEALNYFPDLDELKLGPEIYLDHIRRAKDTVDVPIIASMNGSTAGAWTAYAKQIEQAGADAIELNIYWLPTDVDQSAAEVEERYLEIVHAVRAETTLPLAVKLSPFFSNLMNLTARLQDAGAEGFVLFNRFMQPDLDLEALEINPRVLLSTSSVMRLPMTWIGLMFGRIRADLAATSGIHTAHDVLKMLMVGANVTMVCSLLLKRGIGQILVLERDVRQWMEAHEYESVRQMRGSLSQQHCPDPSAFERAQYVRALQSRHPDASFPPPSSGDVDEAPDC